VSAQSVDFCRGGATASRLAPAACSHGPPHTGPPPGAVAARRHVWAVPHRRPPKGSRQARAGGSGELLGRHRSYGL